MDITLKHLPDDLVTPADRARIALIAASHLHTTADRLERSAITLGDSATRAAAEIVRAVANEMDNIRVS